RIAGSMVPLILAGDSAGANLVAVTAILARDATHRDIALQVLFYPVTDGSLQTASYAENAKGYAHSGHDGMVLESLCA
ncbi:MAG: alpha/beta hydrolase fold domain-containing protein, partial [Steroidobacteraceae bacterium]